MSLREKAVPRTWEYGKQAEAQQDDNGSKNGECEIKAAAGQIKERRGVDRSTIVKSLTNGGLWLVNKLGQFVQTVRDSLD